MRRQQIAINDSYTNVNVAAERSSSIRPTFDRFMQDELGILTGHSSGGAALVQMLIVPVLLTAGVAVMGIAAAIII